MVRAVAVALCVAAATSPASAEPRCDLGPDGRAALVTPLCWDAGAAGAAREALAVELATYGIEQVSAPSPAADAPAIAIQIAGACAGQPTATVTVERAGRTTQTRVSLDDVADADRARILALAVGELVATACAAPEPVAEPARGSIPTVSLPRPPPPPPAAAPPSPEATGDPAIVAVFGAGELRWFEAQDALQLGGVAGVRVPRAGFELGAGIAWFGAGARDALGDVTMWTVAGRGDAGRTVLELGQLALSARASIELGSTFGAGEPRAPTASAESERTLYASAGAGAVVSVRMAPWLTAEVSGAAVYSRGQVAAAGGRELLGTGGASVVVAIGIGVPL